MSIKTIFKSIQSAIIDLSLIFMPNFLLAKVTEATTPVPDLSVAAKYVNDDELPPDEDIDDSWREIHAMLRESSKTLDSLKNDTTAIASPFLDNAEKNPKLINTIKINHPELIISQKNEINKPKKEVKKTTKSSALSFCFSLFSFCTSDSVLPDKKQSSPKVMRMV